MNDEIHDLFINTVIKAKDNPVGDQIYGTVTLGGIDQLLNLYREKVTENMLTTNGVLTRYFEEVIAKLPPPPDPFWKEWEL